MNYQQFVIKAVSTADSYPYLTREMQKPLHPILVAMLDAGAIPQSNCVELVHEWPHVSKDGKRIAYTETTEKGEADRQSVMQIGDYLSRYS